MSGICAVLEFGGAPAGSNTIGRLTQALASRGPDAQQVWTAGPVALGHALLRVTPEPDPETQPFSFDGNVWIVADARIDSRHELADQLALQHPRDWRALPDAALILGAYLAWGERAPEHLLGDFAFIVWDGDRQLLFCAVDQLGLKPLYYAREGSRLLMSSSQTALRQTASLSGALNELAVADFLLFAYNQDVASTTYAAIRRVQPAHSMTVAAAGEVRERRYWNFEVEDELRYRRPADYVEQFTEVLSAAVGDRLRTNDSVAFLLSGGLDSTSVAALACCRLGLRASSAAAFTLSFEPNIRHEEPAYAASFATDLGLPLHVFSAGGYDAYQRYDDPDFQPPEPVNEPFLAAWRDQYREIAQVSRVALTGECGDEVLRGSTLDPGRMLRQGRWAELGSQIATHTLRYRQFPAMGIRTRLRRLLAASQPVAKRLVAPPVWIERSFERRLDLSGRLRKLMAPSRVHPYRADAYDAVITNPFRHCLNEYDPEHTRSPIEFRHPFLDLRVVRLALRLPAFPWCFRKYILREAMRGLLPEAIRVRPKTPLYDDPLLACFRRPGWRLERLFDPAQGLEKYLDIREFRQCFDNLAGVEAWQNCRGISLNYWLRCAVH